MDLGRFMTGALIGGTIGMAGAAYLMASDREKKKLMRQSRQMFNKASRTMQHMI